MSVSGVTIPNLPLGSTPVSTDMLPLAILPLGTVRQPLSAIRDYIYNSLIKRFNVVSYGGTGDGVADDTAAFSAALAAAAAVTPRGVVYAPRGTWKVTGGFDFGGLHGCGFVGDGPSTVIDIAHATNDLFVYSNHAGSGHTRDLTFRDFKVTSSVARTGGWVIRGTGGYNDTNRFLINSRVSDIVVEKQCNGFAFSGYINVRVSRCFLHDFVGSGGIGIRCGQTAATSVNQGADIYFDSVGIMGQNVYTSSGTGTTLLSYGWWIEDCDALYMNHCATLGVLENSLRMVAGGYGLNAHFIRDSIFDVTRNSHCVKITGSTPALWITFDNNWISAAGLLTGGAATARGVSIEGSDIRYMKLMGNRIRVNKASGIYVVTTSTNDCQVIGNIFSENGGGATANDNHDIAVDVGSGNQGPTIHDNKSSASSPSNGVCLRTSSTSSKISVRDNIWPNGWTYGVQPEDSDGNRTANSTSERAIVTSVQTDANTTEKDLWTEVVKANALSRNGQYIKVEAYGDFSANANTKTLRFYIGTHSFTVNEITTAPNGVNWHVSVIVWRSGASTGRRVKSATVGNIPQFTVGSTGLTDAWSSDVTLKITGQNGTASAADIVLHAVTYEPHLDS